MHATIVNKGDTKFKRGWYGKLCGKGGFSDLDTVIIYTFLKRIKLNKQISKRIYFTDQKKKSEQHIS